MNATSEPGGREPGRHVSPEVVEALGPVMSKGEALGLERQARRHYKTASRNLMQLCADLRRLQDGGAHFVRGFKSFGAYIEHTFDGLTAANAKQLSRQGHVLLVLESHDRISLAGQGTNLPGTTGLRALSGVLGAHGEDAMLEVYDRATRLRPDRRLVADTVATVLKDMMAALIEHTPDNERLDADVEVLDEDDPDDPDDEDEDSVEVAELRDRLLQLGALVRDLAYAVDPLAAGDSTQAHRTLAELTEELDQVRQAIAAVEDAA
jgi:hypothetical protein